MKRVVRLTESQLHDLVRRIVEESEFEMHSQEMEESMENDMNPEMEEGLGDMVKGVKRFATGYGSKEEKEQRIQDFYDELDEIEDEFNSNPENFFFSDWDSKKEQLIKKAEENNFLGHIEQIGKKDKYVRYVPGKKGFEKMATGYGRAQGETIYERRRR